MKHALLVGLGGFAGAIARYQLGAVVHRRLGLGFPHGTLAVNVLGCLLIGVLMIYAESGQMRQETRLLLTTGLLGSLTTFSTFGHETFALMDAGRVPAALLNVSLNVGVGLAAVVIGRILGRALAG